MIAGSPSPDVYNALGQRVVHTWPGAEIDWLYHPDGSELADFMPVPWNDWGNSYFNLNGRPIAKYIGVSPQGEWPAETYFFHANALGSTTMATDWKGDVRQKEIFYPYGQFWAWGGDLNSFRFASLGENLPNSEIPTFMSRTRDLQGRYYRWLSTDPLAGDIMNPQSLNRYAYVGNNPVNAVDPLGLCSAQSEDYPACVFAGEQGWGPFGSCGIMFDPWNCGPYPMGGDSLSVDMFGNTIFDAIRGDNGASFSNFYNLQWGTSQSDPFALFFGGTLYGKPYIEFFDTFDEYANWRTDIAALPESQVYAAFAAMCKNLGCDPNKMIQVEYQYGGFVWSASMKGYQVNKNNLSGYRSDPITWFHQGNPSCTPDISSMQRI